MTASTFGRQKVGKIDPSSQFHQHFMNTFCAYITQLQMLFVSSFLYQRVLLSFFLLQFGHVVFWQKNIGAKVGNTMLEKLTSDRTNAGACIFHRCFSVELSAF